MLINKYDLKVSALFCFVSKGVWELTLKIGESKLLDFKGLEIFKHVAECVY